MAHGTGRMPPRDAADTAPAHRTMWAVLQMGTRDPQGTLHACATLCGGRRAFILQCAGDTVRLLCATRRTPPIHTAVLRGHCTRALRYSANLQDAHILGSSHTLNPSDRLRCIRPMDTLHTL